MKKILCLILAAVLCLGCTVALASCKEEVTDVFTYAENLAPTRTTTFVTYKAANGDVLEGEYVLEVNGDDAIFTYTYDKYRTAEEAIEDNDSTPIKTVEGKVYRKDGKYSDDGEIWGSSPVATEIKLNLKRELLSNVNLSEDGNTLTAEIAPDKAEEVLGTTLSANGNIAITAVANGTYLTGVVLTCTTAEGATLEIRTSYSYNVLELVFPE